jgi:predicted lactoylglutathione lyase
VPSESVQYKAAQYEPVTISLPIADRPTSYDFYQRALALQAIGELAEDGVPEPLRFVVNAGLHLMLIPRGGFGWTIGGGEVAAPGQHESFLVLAVPTEAEANALVARAVAAGAELISAPAARPWGYTGSFADPDGHLWLVRAS